ncbi:MAG: energy transducer TonB [Deltaproteobacteria bacterium]|nr:energy transducer TonB [Deltaproteobacteria bacterium]
MNGNRNLIWGVALSLLLHGAFLGMSISPEGQRRILPRQPTPLEISLVKLKAHGDAPPKKKVVPLAQPQRARQIVKARKKRTTKRDIPLTQPKTARQTVKLREQKTTKGEEKPTPVLKKESASPPKAVKAPTPKPEAFIPPQKTKITDDGPRPAEKVGKNPPPSARPPTSVKDPPGGEGLAASIIPKAESRLITLARPRYDRNPKPPYPRVARRRGYEGVVLLKVEILPNGRVGEIQVKKSSGHPMLDRSALKTVRQWRFIPAKRAEEPIRIWAEVPIKFDLE